MSDTVTEEKPEIESQFEASIGEAVEQAIQADEQLSKGGDDARLGENAGPTEEPKVEEQEVEDADEPDPETILPSSDDEDEPQDDEPPVTEDEPDVDIPSDEIPDELLEKAVKAGMTMRSARKFPDAEALQEAIAVISPDTDGSDDEPEATEAKASEVDDLLSQIKDLDPDEYDEELVQNMTVLKSLVSKLAKDNEELRVNSATSGFEANIATLDEDVAKIVRSDAGKRNMLKRKFDALKAGYQAIQENVTDADIFSEASGLVLADDIAKAKTNSKANSAKKRSSQRIARPSGKDVQEAKTDDEEAIELLKSKFKNLS